MNKEFLKKVLSVQTHFTDETRIIKFIIDSIKNIKNIKYTIDNHGNILIVKGDTKKYTCIVAHLDSVHEIIDEEVEIIAVKDNLTLFIKDTDIQIGIGGDDKVGIFIALTLLKKYDNLKVAFFSREEIGCVGSNKVDISFFKDCNIILQADKKGNNEFVCKTISYRKKKMILLNNVYFRRKIEHLVEKQNYKFIFMGYLTDVVTLRERGIKVPCANISCGYYNPHNFLEYVNTSDVRNCLNLIEKIILLFL